MATKVVVEGSSGVTASQMKEMWRQIGDGSLQGFHFDALLEHRNPFVDVPIDWTRVYAELGMFNQFKAASTSLPLQTKAGLWVMPMIQGVTSNGIVKTLRRLGVACSLYAEDLDKNVPTHDRDPAKGSYVVRFRQNVEADQEFAEKSADDLKSEGVVGITLPERLLLELGYFLTTNRHLDVENVTLCSGSRGSVGRVPRVYWDPDSRKVYVHWYISGVQSGGLRARAAVS